MKDTTFFSDESGAVTVDWTVMTAAIVGLGVATYGTVSGGMSDLSGDIDRSLRLMGIPEFARTLMTKDTFDDGDLGEWKATIDAYNDPVLNDMMGPFYDQSGEPVLFRSMEFIGGTQYAVMEFDLTTVGVWEAHDDMRLFVNGEMIDASSLVNTKINSKFDDNNDETQVAYTFVERRSSSSSVADERAEIANNTLNNGATTDRDTIRSNVDRETEYTVQVVVKNPGESMNFAVGRRGTSPYPGEAWGIDNFAVSSSSEEDGADINAGT